MTSSRKYICLHRQNCEEFNGSHWTSQNVLCRHFSSIYCEIYNIPSLPLVGSWNSRHLDEVYTMSEGCDYPAHIPVLVLTLIKLA